MGYDMYRVREVPDISQDEPELKIEEGESAYFRLNMWGMGRARVLASWGVSKLTVDDLIEHEWIMEEATQTVGADGVKSWFDQVMAFRSRCWNSNESDSKRLMEGIQPFGSNGNYASAEECELFSRAIGKAFDKLDSAIIRPDYDYEYYREFAEWLAGSTDGVYVG